MGQVSTTPQPNLNLTQQHDHEARIISLIAWTVCGGGNIMHFDKTASTMGLLGTIC